MPPLGGHNIVIDESSRVKSAYGSYALSEATKRLSSVMMDVVEEDNALRVVVVYELHHCAHADDDNRGCS